MANIKSAKKRIEISRLQRERNKSKKTEIKTYIKKFDAAVEENKADEASELIKIIDKKMKKAALHGVIHKNAASRKLSKLQLKLNAMA